MLTESQFFQWRRVAECAGEKLFIIFVLQLTSGTLWSQAAHAAGSPHSNNDSYHTILNTGGTVLEGKKAVKLSPTLINTELNRLEPETKHKDGAQAQSYSMFYHSEYLGSQIGELELSESGDLLIKNVSKNEAPLMEATHLSLDHLASDDALDQALTRLREKHTQETSLKNSSDKESHSNSVLSSKNMLTLPTQTTTKSATQPVAHNKQLDPIAQNSVIALKATRSEEPPRTLEKSEERSATTLAVTASSPARQNQKMAVSDSAAAFKRLVPPSMIKWRDKVVVTEPRALEQMSDPLIASLRVAAIQPISTLNTPPKVANAAVEKGPAAQITTKPVELAAVYEKQLEPTAQHNLTVSWFEVIPFSFFTRLSGFIEQIFEKVKENSAIFEVKHLLYPCLQPVTLIESFKCVVSLQQQNGAEAQQKAYYLTKIGNWDSREMLARSNKNKISEARDNRLIKRLDSFKSEYKNQHLATINSTSAQVLDVALLDVHHLSESVQSAAHPLSQTSVKVASPSHPTTPELKMRTEELSITLVNNTSKGGPIQPLIPNRAVTSPSHNPRAHSARVKNKVTTERKRVAEKSTAKIIPPREKPELVLLQDRLKRLDSIQQQAMLVTVIALQHLLATPFNGAVSAEQVNQLMKIINSATLLKGEQSNSLNALSYALFNGTLAAFNHQNSLLGMAQAAAEKSIAITLKGQVMPDLSKDEQLKIMDLARVSVELAQELSSSDVTRVATIDDLSKIGGSRNFFNQIGQVVLEDCAISLPCRNQIATRLLIYNSALDIDIAQQIAAKITSEELDYLQRLTVLNDKGIAIHYLNKLEHKYGVGQFTPVSLNVLNQ